MIIRYVFKYWTKFLLIYLFDLYDTAHMHILPSLLFYYYFIGPFTNNPSSKWLDIDPHLELDSPEMK